MTEPTAPEPTTPDDVETPAPEVVAPPAPPSQLFQLTVRRTSAGEIRGDFLGIARGVEDGDLVSALEDVIEELRG